MKTLNEILDNYKDYAVVLDDRFGSRLAKFLTEEQLEKIGFKYDGDEPYPEPKEWTRENILVQLKEDVEFGFEKALDKRGISASSLWFLDGIEFLRKAQRIIQRITMLCMDCHYLRLLRKSMAGRILSETIVEARTIITKSMMKDCTASHCRSSGRI